MNFKSNFPFRFTVLKFIYSEKATKFCEIFPLLLTVCTAVKSKGKILQNFVAFSEHMNFKYLNKLSAKSISNIPAWIAISKVGKFSNSEAVQSSKSSLPVLKS